MLLCLLDMDFLWIQKLMLLERTLVYDNTGQFMYVCLILLIFVCQMNRFKPLRINYLIKCKYNVDVACNKTSKHAQFTKIGGGMTHSCISDK